MIASPETLEVDSPITTASAPKGVEASPPDAADENLYLNGRPTMKDFIRYVRSHAVHPPGEGTLVEEWQAANDVVRALEKDEAGCADHASINKIEINLANPSPVARVPNGKGTGPLYFAENGDITLDQGETVTLIRRILIDEEIRFSNLLDRGRKVLSHERFHKSLDDTDYEYLHETHGLPRELVDSLR